MAAEDVFFFCSLFCWSVGRRHGGRVGARQTHGQEVQGAPRPLQGAPPPLQGEAQALAGEAPTLAREALGLARTLEGVPAARLVRRVRRGRRRPSHAPSHAPTPSHHHHRGPGLRGGHHDDPPQHAPSPSHHRGPGLRREHHHDDDDDDDAPSQTVDAGTEQPAALETPLKTARSHRKKNPNNFTRIHLEIGSSSSANNPLHAIQEPNRNPRSLCHHVSIILES